MTVLVSSFLSELFRSCIFVVMPLFPKIGVVNMHFLYLSIGPMHLKYSAPLTSMKTLSDVVWLMQ